MSGEKNMMVEAAILYYEKKKTQQEIAQMMKLSRQTVSKLLNDAVSENVVEIKIHNPEKDCGNLERKLCKNFEIQHAVVCTVSGRDETVRQLMTVKKAAEYILPMIQKGNKNIALSWGRTLQAFIAEFPRINAKGNTVFPLFGATDSEKTCFLSNELARSFADKIGAEGQYAWFPYRPDQEEDCELLKKTSYYQKIHTLWSHVDIAIVGIGNTTVWQMFEQVFGYHGNSPHAAGDIATHLFAGDGTLINPYKNALCASAENLRNAKQTIAIACSNNEGDKVEAMIGALHTGLINTLITDEHTAQKILVRGTVV